MSYWLVLVKFERIKGYMLATRGMAQIRGASAILRETNENGFVRHLIEGGFGSGSHRFDGTDVVETSASVDGTADWELVFAAGGLAQILFKQEAAARRFAADVPALALRATGAVRAVASVHCCGDLAHGYGDLVRRATLSAPPVPTGLPALPSFMGGFVVPCSECEEAPAEAMHTMRGASRAVCGACLRKQKRGARLASQPLGAEELVQQWAAERRESRSVAMPRTIDDLASKSRPRNYLAYIEADGDGMGAHLAALASREEYREFSKCLAAAISTAWAEACKVVFDDSIATMDMLPVRLLISGGDDLLAMCDPSSALLLADAFCAAVPGAYAGALRGLGLDPKAFIVPPESVSVSAGILIAGKSFPFSEFQRLGKELQDSAKTRSRTERASGAPEWLGAIDFQTSSAAAIPSIHDARRPVGDGNRRPTAKPYAAGPEGMGRLIDTARTLQDVSPGKLQGLIEILDRDDADRQFGYVLSRLGKTQAISIIKLLESLGGGSGSPWVSRGNELISPIADLVEVVGLLGGR